jgi:hypothetical protein
MRLRPPLEKISLSDVGVDVPARFAYTTASRSAWRVQTLLSCLMHLSSPRRFLAVNSAWIIFGARRLLLGSRQSRTIIIQFGGAVRAANLYRTSSRRQSSVMQDISIVALPIS